MRCSASGRGHNGWGDDIVATAGSLVEAAEALRKKGVVDVYAAVTHGVLSGSATQRVRDCKALRELVVTDSIPLKDSKKHPKIRVLSVAALLAEAIKRIHNEESVSSLFDDTKR